MNKKKYNRIPFFLFCIIATIIMVVMFTQVGVFHEQEDFPAHNLSAQEIYTTPISEMSFPLVMSYPLMHTVLKLVGLIVSFFSFGTLSLSFSIDIASVVVATIFNVITIFIVRFILTGLFSLKSTTNRYIIDFISITSVFIMGICGPLTDYKFYLPQGGPNVWHNPTFIFSRPFGIIVFFLFTGVFSTLKNNQKFKQKLVLFSLVLCISCIAKPNYAFVLLPAMGVITLIEIKDDFRHKIKTIGIPLLLSVLPAGIILIFQFIYVTGTFANGNVYTIIKFGSQFDMSFWLSVRSTISLLIIPILIFVTTGHKHLKTEAAYLLSLLTVIVGWIQYYFLYQTGEAFGDYFWGYGLSTHLAIVVSLGILLKYEKRKPVVFSAFALYLIQLFYGLQYFFGILGGNDFIVL